MSQRPPRDIDWVPDNSTGINVPSQTKQNAGWLVEKPARQFFNWMWNRLSRWTHYFSGQSQEFIVIDSTNANEKDYDTLAAYIADSPAAGDKVLVKETQALTAQMIIPSFITLRILDGVYFTRSTNEAASVIKFGSDIIIEGIMNLFLSHTGTIAKAIEFDGDNVVGKINVENSSTGILTTAYHINASKTGNRVDGFAQNTGGGTLTNIIVDNSTEDSNSLFIVDEINNIIVSTSLVNVNAAQTLTNKTLTSPIINTPSSSGHVYGDKYTPSETIVSNLDSLTVEDARFVRVGNIVTVSGFIAIDLTASGVQSSFRLSLPIASSLSNSHELSGVASSEDTAAVFPWGIIANTANNEAFFYGVPTFGGAGTMPLHYTFSYEIL